MSPVTVTFNPLCWLTPAQLAACAVLFFLPWVEIQCSAPRDPKNLESKEVVWAAFLHQSGWQVMMGEVDFSDSTFQQLAAQQQRAADDREHKPSGAPLLLFYCLAIAGGFAAGLVLRPGAVRGRVLTVCCALALVTVGGQVVLGLPVETSMDASRAKLDGKPAAKNDLGGLMTERMRTRYKWPVYATLVLTASALLTALIEPGAPKTVRREEPPASAPESDPPVASA